MTRSSTGSRPPPDAALQPRAEGHRAASLHARAARAASGHRTRGPTAAALALALFFAGPAGAADRLNLLDYAPPGTQVDRTGKIDAAPALARAVTAANVFTARGEPACIYIPPGIYRINTPPPAFVRAGCVEGDGTSQAILSIDPGFSGDLFAWSEAWFDTTPGPRVVGITVRGDQRAAALQNAFVFYDRNDEVYLEDIDVWTLHGRAIYSGVTRGMPIAYMRESHLKSLRFFQDGALGVPVMEFSSEGSGNCDATNEIRMSQIDIYGAYGPSLAIRNNGTGHIRNITADSLRIEGPAYQAVQADLLMIGDSIMKGDVNNITFTNLELINPSKGYAALHINAPSSAAAPYQISVQGSIGGGTPAGDGIKIDAGRDSIFRLSALHTLGVNIIIGAGVSGILLDGGGHEGDWTYDIAPTSRNGIWLPKLRLFQR